MTNATEAISKTESWKLFNRIAGRYDRLNRILSLGIDLYWRRALTRSLPPGSKKVLDLATGTADQLIDIVARNPGIEEAIGSDMSEGMLELGRQKIKARRLLHKISLIPADAQAVPLGDNYFDAVSISFGIRNVPNVSKALSEMFRVLKPGGKALILEFSTPPNLVFRAYYFFYLRYILPRIGGWISGDTAAYRYLNQTIEVFPYGNAFCEGMSKVGFTKAGFRPLTFGIATLYTAEKPV